MFQHSQCPNSVAEKPCNVPIGLISAGTYWTFYCSQKILVHLEIFKKIFLMRSIQIFSFGKMLDIFLHENAVIPVHHSYFEPIWFAARCEWTFLVRMLSHLMSCFIKNDDAGALTALDRDTPNRSVEYVRAWSLSYAYCMHPVLVSHHRGTPSLALVSYRSPWYHRGTPSLALVSYRSPWARNCQPITCVPSPCRLDDLSMPEVKLHSTPRDNPNVGTNEHPGRDKRVATLKLTLSPPHHLVGRCQALAHESSSNHEIPDEWPFFAKSSSIYRNLPMGWLASHVDDVRS